MSILFIEVRTGNEGICQLSGEMCFRTAELAKWLASVLCSRRTWEMEKSMERASLRQIQFRELEARAAVGVLPFICRMTTRSSLLQTSTLI